MLFAEGGADQVPTELHIRWILLRYSPNEPELEFLLDLRSQFDCLKSPGAIFSLSIAVLGGNGGHLYPTQIFCRVISHVVGCGRSTRSQTRLQESARKPPNQLTQTSRTPSQNVRRTPHNGDNADNAQIY